MRTKFLLQQRMPSEGHLEKRIMSILEGMVNDSSDLSDSQQQRFDLLFDDLTSQFPKDFEIVTRPDTIQVAIKCLSIAKWLNTCH